MGAQDALSAHSLKGLSLAEFEANFVVQRQSFSVLKHLYGSRGFGKRRFVLQQRKQAFDANFTNHAAATFQKEAATDDFVVAYGDGTFPLSMKGMDGGGSAHKISADDTSLQEGAHRPYERVPHNEGLSLLPFPQFEDGPTTRQRDLR